MGVELDTGMLHFSAIQGHFESYSICFNLQVCGLEFGVVMWNNVWRHEDIQPIFNKPLVPGTCWDDVSMHRFIQFQALMKATNGPRPLLWTNPGISMQSAVVCFMIDMASVRHPRRSHTLKQARLYYKQYASIQDAMVTNSSYSITLYNYILAIIHTSFDYHLDHFQLFRFIVVLAWASLIKRLWLACCSWRQSWLSSAAS